MSGSMHNPKDMEHDLKGRRVLVSSQEQICYFLDFIFDDPRGEVLALPTKWPVNDESWRKRYATSHS